MEEGAADGGSRGTVLLVDDEPAIRRQLTTVLERSGYAVVTASSVVEACERADALYSRPRSGRARAEACERADALPPDFAVLDLNLDDGHGLQFIETLLEIRPGCRTVVLTGYDSIASSVRALRAGAVGYLAKPVRAEALIDALEGRGLESTAPSPSPMSADRVRREHIQRVFEQCDRNISETARRLGMHRRTLQRILAKRAPR